jgi:mevalonate kinase
MTFETKVSGKWILAGEHAVLRGSPALVFPLFSRTLNIEYETGPEDLSLLCEGEHGEELQLIFWGVVERACELKKIRRQGLNGKVKIRSSIPIGAGLGASAALSVGIGRWFQSLKLVQENEVYEFARTLENLFHGESSGVDIAVALSNQPIRFLRQGERKVFQPSWQPKWYLSYSGKRGVTSECVNRVKELHQQNSSFATQLDEQMKQAVGFCEQALQTNEQEGFSQLLEGMTLAKNCFEKWGLTQGQPESHMKWLEAQGAAVTKPTGSGGGGYVLSLWKESPDQDTLKNLIPCF